MTKRVDSPMEGSQLSTSSGPTDKSIKLRVALDALEAYIASDTWAEAKHIVEVYRDVLLTDMIDDVLVALISQYDDGDAVRILTQYRKVLVRCRLDGIHFAFADLLTERETCPPGVELALWRRVLLADSYMEVMELLAEHPELIPYISRHIVRTLSAQQQTLFYALGALMDAGSWYEAQEIIETYPALLSLDADIWLAQCATSLTQQGEFEAAEIITARRWLLADCRLGGIDAAFSERLPILDGVLVDIELNFVLDWAVHDLAQAV